MQRILLLCQLLNKNNPVCRQAGPLGSPKVVSNVKLVAIMNKKTILTFILFLLCRKFSFSQTNYSLVETPKFSFALPDANFVGIKNNTFQLFDKKPIVFFMNVPRSSFELNHDLHFSHYEIPKGAVFCRIENNLRNTFNIWIKVRAGTDESYNTIRTQ